jgi:ferredoxin
LCTTSSSWQTCYIPDRPRIPAAFFLWSGNYSIREKVRCRVRYAHVGQTLVCLACVWSLTKLKEDRLKPVLLTALTREVASVRIRFRNPHYWRSDVAYSAPSIEEYQAGTVVKHAPISTGTTTQRKRKPHILAVINECCTGCSGSPACVEYCPVADCMYWAPDEDHAPFGRIIVDPLLCIGCKLCTSKGPDGAFLEGCPWDAIDMVPLAEFEGANGTLPF